MALRLVTHTVKHKPQIGALAQSKLNLLEKAGARIGVDRDEADAGKRDAGLIQAIPDRFRRKPRPMLDAPEPLLLRRRDNLAVADEAGGAIAMVGVEAEDDHGSALCFLLRTCAQSQP